MVHNKLGRGYSLREECTNDSNWANATTTTAARTAKFGEAMASQGASVRVRGATETSAMIRSELEALGANAHDEGDGDLLVAEVAEEVGQAAALADSPGAFAFARRPRGLQSHAMR